MNQKEIISKFMSEAGKKGRANLSKKEMKAHTTRMANSRWKKHYLKEWKEAVIKEIKEKGLHLGYKNNIIDIIKNYE